MVTGHAILRRFFLLATYHEARAFITGPKIDPLSAPAMGYYCSICLESISPTTSDGSGGCQPALVTTSCGHHFHLECAMGYAAHKGATQATALSSDQHNATPRLTVDCPLCRSQLAEIPWNNPPAPTARNFQQPHHHAIVIPAGSIISSDGSDVFIYEETIPRVHHQDPARQNINNNQHSCYQHLEPGLKISAAIWFGTLLYLLIWGSGT